jgi:hypothetical protein
MSRFARPEKKFTAKGKHLTDKRDVHGPDIPGKIRGRVEMNLQILNNHFEISNRLELFLENGLQGHPAQGLFIQIRTDEQDLLVLGKAFGDVFDIPGLKRLIQSFECRSNPGFLGLGVRALCHHLGIPGRKMRARSRENERQHYGKTLFVHEILPSSDRTKNFLFGCTGQVGIVVPGYPFNQRLGL